MLINGYATLLLLLGFPRFPGSDWPLAVLVLLFYTRTIVREFRVHAMRVSLANFVVFFLMGIALYFSNRNSQQVDGLFLLTIFLKAVLSLLSAIVIVEILEKSAPALLIWILTQAVLVLLSIYSSDVFDFLVEFSGKAGFDTYSELYGIRGVGFGIVHVYGVYTAMTSTFLYMALSRGHYLSSLTLWLAQAIFIILARTGLPIIFIYLMIFSKLRLAAAIFLFFGFSYLVYLLGVDSGIIYNVFELGINFISASSLATASTDANLMMWIFPDSLLGWVFGEGRFFEGGEFYRGTDIGYSRVLLYGGLGFLFLYIWANVYPLFSTFLLFKSKAYRRCLGASVSYVSNISRLSHVVLLAFLVCNTKGVVDIGVIGFTLQVMVNRKLRVSGQ